MSNFSRNNGLLPWVKHYIYYLLKKELISPQKAAETIIYLSTALEVSETTGKYFFDKKEIKSSSASYNKEASLTLWKLSLTLCELEDIKLI